MALERCEQAVETCHVDVELGHGNATDHQHGYDCENGHEAGRSGAWGLNLNEGWGYCFEGVMDDDPETCIVVKSGMSLIDGAQGFLSCGVGNGDEWGLIDGPEDFLSCGVGNGDEWGSIDDVSGSSCGNYDGERHWD